VSMSTRTMTGPPWRLRRLRRCFAWRATTGPASRHCRCPETSDHPARVFLRTEPARDAKGVRNCRALAAAAREERSPKSTTSRDRSVCPQRFVSSRSRGFARNAVEAPVTWTVRTAQMALTEHFSKALWRLSCSDQTAITAPCCSHPGRRSQLLPRRAE